jgi:hypothetical protein
MVGAPDKEENIGNSYPYSIQHKKKNTIQSRKIY